MDFISPLLHVFKKGANLKKDDSKKKKKTESPNKNTKFGPNKMADMGPDRNFSIDPVVVEFMSQLICLLIQSRVMFSFLYNKRYSILII